MGRVLSLAGRYRVRAAAEDCRPHVVAVDATHIQAVLVDQRVRADQVVGFVAGDRIHPARDPEHGDGEIGGGDDDAHDAAVARRSGRTRPGDGHGACAGWPRSMRGSRRVGRRRYHARVTVGSRNELTHATVVPASALQKKSPAAANRVRHVLPAKPYFEGPFPPCGGRTGWGVCTKQRELTPHPDLPPQGGKGPINKCAQMITQPALGWRAEFLDQSRQRQLASFAVGRIGLPLACASAEPSSRATAIFRKRPCRASAGALRGSSGSTASSSPTLAK